MYPSSFINWIGDNGYRRDSETGQWLTFPDYEKDWIAIAENLEELYQIYEKTTTENP